MGRGRALFQCLRCLEGIARSFEPFISLGETMVNSNRNHAWRHGRRAAKYAVVSALTMMTSSVALMHATYAQPTGATQAAASPEVEEVVVTGTLVIRDGYQAPTPVTVVGIEQIQQTAPTSVADFINTLPALGGGTSTHQAGGGVSFQNKGTNTINLRGLGNTRTLVLLDGKRLPPVSSDGTADLSAIPESLVQRVDVVTGGASAAYGSDAVAGVVNIVLDSKYTGVKGEVQSGITTYGDDLTTNVKLSAGFPFADSRGHVLFSADFAYVDGQFKNNRDWAGVGWMQLVNPAYAVGNGQPEFIFASNVGSSRQTYGGIINSGPLKGTYFGPGGVPATLNFGPINNGTYMVGGDWEYTNFAREAGLDQRNSRKGVFLRSSYDVTDNFAVYVEASYSHSKVLYKCCNNFTSTSLTIKADNAFIPASVATRIAALGITQFTIGTQNGDIGATYSNNNRIFHRYRIGASGKVDAFGDTWSWDAYAQRGHSRATNLLKGAYLRAEYARAYDAVRSPSNGSIICRSTLTNPNDGCVPYNVMGEGVNSQAAINYVTGEPYLYQPYIQDGVGASITGEPFSTWVGPISVATGVDWRRDNVRSINDPFSSAAGYFAGNYGLTDGTFKVIEGFGETVIPLAKDASWARQLDLNGAVRLVNYSQAGFAATWKVGITYNPIDDIRVRLTRSRDIRAPNLSELFAAPGGAAVTIIDPFRVINGVRDNYVISYGTGGNTNLTPEKADNTGLGIVYQPSWLPGFTTSLDFYDIKIKDVISTVPGGNQLLRCFDGETQFCSSIIRAAPTPGENLPGRVTRLIAQPFNFASHHAQGFDVEATYRVDMADLISDASGTLTLRALATHVITDKSDDGAGTIIENAGVNSATGPLRWRTNLSINYNNDIVSVGITERLISSGVYNNQYIVCTSGCPLSTTRNQTTNYNTIKGIAYTDLNFGYRFGEDKNMQLFAAVQNLWNTDPPTSALLNYNYPANGTFYDVMGRTIRAGFRFAM